MGCKGFVKGFWGGTQGNSGELRGTQGNSGELRGTQGNSGELKKMVNGKWPIVNG